MQREENRTTSGDSSNRAHRSPNTGAGNRTEPDDSSQQGGQVGGVVPCKQDTGHMTMSDDNKQQGGV